MTTHSAVDMNSDTSAELETEKTLDMATDVEAGLPSNTKPETHRSYFEFFSQILICLVVFSAIEVFIQVGMLGAGLLCWPAIVVSLSARITIMYVSLKSALSVSTRSEVWQALNTGHIRGKPITKYLSMASMMMQCYAFGWTVFIVLITCKSETDAEAQLANELSCTFHIESVCLSWRDYHGVLDNWSITLWHT